MAFLSRLRLRERIPELMDDPAIDPTEHRRALAALARINRVTNSAGVLWPVIPVLARELNRAVRVLDVATGSGDVPARLLARAAERRHRTRGRRVRCQPDRDRRGRRAWPRIEFFVHDALHRSTADRV